MLLARCAISAAKRAIFHVNARHRRPTGLWELTVALMSFQQLHLLQRCRVVARWQESLHGETRAPFLSKKVKTSLMPKD